MTIFGMTRIRDESKWIEEVLRSYLPICERIWVLDDHSSDNTPNICEAISERITVIRTPYEGLDESRDKTYLLGRVMGNVSDINLSGDEKSPYFSVCFDGDEVLAPGGVEIIKTMLHNTRYHAFKLPIWYLWNDRYHRRVDGVYANFARPSIFRLMNRAFGFQKTPWGNGANFHCSSIPQELLHHAHAVCPAPILHLGYMDMAHRRRKMEWYQSIDPNNVVEDSYRHICQGDPGGEPANVRLRHAGPLQIISL